MSKEPRYVPSYIAAIGAEFRSSMYFVRMATSDAIIRPAYGWHVDHSAVSHFQTNRSVFAPLELFRHLDLPNCTLVREKKPRPPALRPISIRIGDKFEVLAIQ
jgi:hypothetical protein